MHSPASYKLISASQKYIWQSIFGDEFCRCLIRNPSSWQIQSFFLTWRWCWGRHERMCTKFHCNPSNSCWHISVWTKVVGRPTNRQTSSSVNKNRVGMCHGLKPPKNTENLKKIHRTQDCTIQMWRFHWCCSQGNRFLGGFWAKKRKNTSFSA